MTKRWLEQISEAIGFEGEINDAVIDFAEDLPTGVLVCLDDEGQTLVIKRHENGEHEALGSTQIVAEDDEIQNLIKVTQETRLRNVFERGVKATNALKELKDWGDELRGLKTGDKK
jgi:hypothetical protein